MNIANTAVTVDRKDATKIKLMKGKRKSIFSLKIIIIIITIIGLIIKVDTLIKGNNLLNGRIQK